MFAALIVVAGVALAAWIAHERAEDHDAAVRHDLEVVADEMQAVIDRSTAGLAGAPGILDPSGQISEAASIDRFHGFARGISGQAPVVAIALATVVTDADRAEFEAEHDFGIVDEPTVTGAVASADRDEYYPVIAMYPDNADTRVMLGVDIGEEPARSVAAEAALDSGAAALTPPVDLAYSDDVGILLLQPLFRPDEPVGTEAQRRQALVGFVSISYSVEDLLDEARAPTTNLAAATVLDAASTAGTVGAVPEGWVEQSFELGDREWLIRARSTPGPPIWPSILVVVTSVLLAGLLAELARRSWRYDRELAAWGDALVDEQHRTRGLQSLTATLTAALTVPEVTAAVESQGVALIGAAHGRLEVDAAGNPRVAPPPIDDAVVSASSESRQPIRQKEVSIRTADGAVGQLVATFRAGTHFTAQDEAMMRAVGDLAGDALGRAMRYDSEHEMVTALQAMLLPNLPRQLGPIELAALYRPVLRSSGVGGDWYDVLDTDAGPACMIGDVVGKGVRAAGVMGQLRIATRTLPDLDDPAAVLSALDELAKESNDAYMATFAYVVVDLRRRALRTGVAGHPPPLLLLEDQPSVWLDGETGPPLGVRPAEGGRTCSTTSWEGRARLVLYTDGLVEQRGESIDDGLVRLRRAAHELRDLPAEGFTGAVADALAPADEQSDDLAILCVDLPPVT